jgi:hypothetical protein
MPDFGIMRGFNDKLFGDKLVAGQLPTQLGLIGSSNFGFDPDAQAFFDRVTTAGGSLTTTEKNATNTLVIQMKADGTWTPMKAIYPMVGASAAACAQNLKSSSFTGTFTSGWTFASTGVTGNGTSSFMDSTLIPSNELSLTSGHYSIYSRTNIDSLSIDMGALSGTQVNHQLWLRFSNTTYFRYSNANSAGTLSGQTSSLGHYILNRNSITNTNGYKNGSAILTELQTAALPTVSIYIGARNSNGSFTLPTTREYAFASIGDGLTDTQASNFYTAVQAFQTTLSRQV